MPASKTTAKSAKPATDQTAADRPPRRRWGLKIGILLAILIGAIGYVQLGRYQATAAMEETIAEAEATQLATSFAEIIIAMPILDEEHQQAWLAWSSQAYQNPSEAQMALRDAETPWEAAVTSYVANRSPEARATIETLLALPHEDFTEGRALLASGTVSTSDLSEILVQAEDAANPTIQDLITRDVPGTFPVVPLARWLRLEALTAEQSDPAYDQLDLLAEATTQSGGSDQALLGMQVGAIRNRAYVQGALLNRLPLDNVTSWLAETSAAVTRLADAVAIDRVTLLTVYHANAESMIGPTPALMGDEWTIGRWWNGYVHGLQDCMVIHRALLAWEQYLRGAVVERPEPLPWNAQRDVMGVAFAPETNADNLTMAITANVQHRATRMAVVLIRLHRDTGVILPADAAEARARLRTTAFDAGRFRPALTYERLSDNRFRFSVDPATIDEATGLTEAFVTEHSRFGEPASEATLVIDGLTVEVQLPR